MLPIFRKKQSLMSTSHELLLTGQIRSSGTIACEEDIYIDNMHSGDIVCKGLITIGPNGAAEGNITARVIKIFGAFKGNMRATGSVSIESSAHISNCILSTKALSIVPGSSINDVRITTI